MQTKTHISVLPSTGQTFELLEISVTTAKGSDNPLNAPATFFSPLAQRDSCTFIFVDMKLCKIKK